MKAFVLISWITLGASERKSGDLNSYNMLKLCSSNNSEHSIQMVSVDGWDSSSIVQNAIFMGCVIFVGFAYNPMYLRISGLRSC